LDGRKLAAEFLVLTLITAVDFEKKVVQVVLTLLREGIVVESLDDEIFCLAIDWWLYLGLDGRKLAAEFVVLTLITQFDFENKVLRLC
jgi:hypothetical protein